MDCKLYKSFCYDDLDLPAFPTLFLYKDGKKMEEYLGGLDAPSLIKYITDKIPTTRNTANEESKPSSNNVQQEETNSNNNNVKPKIKVEAEEQVSIVPPKQETKQEQLKQEEQPVKQEEQFNLEENVESTFILFVGPQCSSCESIQAKYTKSHSNNNNELKFLTIDCAKQEKFCNQQQIKEYPIMSLFKLGKMTEKTLIKSVESMEEFINKHLLPPVKPLKPSERRAEEQLESKVVEERVKEEEPKAAVTSSKGGLLETGQVVELTEDTFSSQLKTGPWLVVSVIHNTCNHNNNNRIL